MSLIVNIAATFSGKKALKDAQKQVNVLESSVKKLGTTLGISLSTAAVVAFGKASVKAFAEDEKAASRLAGVLDNLGLAFANPQIAAYIEDLSRATGVIDDQLRPAMQALVTTTGSLTNSQKLLAQAVDISAGSGQGLTTVANDLAQAYVGNTRGLRKYNLGLTQAQLKAASFEEIQARLTKLFSGANAKYLTTYAGKMQVLATAADEAKETIGQGLVDALITLGGDTSVSNLATDMQNAADYTADVVRGLGNIIDKFNKMPKIGGENALLQIASLGQFSKIKQVLDLVAKSGNTKQSTGFSFFGSPMETTQKARDAAAAAKAEKIARDRAKALLKAQTDNTKELKKQALAKKQSALFDLEQIQIIAALKGKISDEERLRLNLQLALITGNEDQAKKLSAELANSIDQTGNLAKYLTTLPDAKNPFASWDAYLTALEERIKKLNVNPPPSPSPTPTPTISSPSGTAYEERNQYIPQTNAATVPSTGATAGGYAGAGSNAMADRASYVGSIQVNIDGKEIANALLDQSMSGNNAYLNRRIGGFD